MALNGIVPPSPSEFRPEQLGRVGGRPDDRRRNGHGKLRQHDVAGQWILDDDDDPAMGSARSTQPADGRETGEKGTAIVGRAATVETAIGDHRGRARDLSHTDLDSVETKSTGPITQQTNGSVELTMGRPRGVERR